MSEAQEARLGSLFDPEPTRVVAPPSGVEFDCGQSFKTNDYIQYGSGFLSRFREGREKPCGAMTVECLTLRLGAVSESVQRVLSGRSWLSRRTFHHVLTQRRSLLAERGKNIFLVLDSAGGRALWVCVQHLTTLWKVYTVPPSTVELQAGDRIFVGEAEKDSK